MKTRVLMGAVFAGAMSASASASTLVLKFADVNPGVGISYVFDGNGGSTTAGVFNWTVQAGTTASGFSVGQSVKTFCTQLNENISGGQTVTYGMVGTNLVPDNPPASPGNMGYTKAKVMHHLYANYYQTAITGGATQAAAFQILVWEISHEAIAAGATALSYLNSLDVVANTGQFYVTNQGGPTGARTLAASWLTALKADAAANGFDPFSVNGLTNPALQDQLIVVVPVPAPALLAGLGLIGAVAVRRRMTKA